MDYAAASPLDERVLKAMLPFFSDKFYNPSASYQPASAVRAEIDKARSMVAHWLGCRSNEIVFTAGGTEANNLAISGVLQAHPGSEIVTSSIEHESVLAPVSHYSSYQAPVLSDGTIDIKALIDLVTDKTSLVSVMYANNEIGTIQPLREISAELNKLRRLRQKDGNSLPLYLHTDAAQAGNYLDLHTSRLGVDLMTINGGKIYGPKQSGALFVRGGVVLEPQIVGGGQERGLRSGTENVPAVIGLATALDIAQNQRKDESARLSKLQDLFFSLLGEAIPIAVINGSRRSRLPNNMHFTLPGYDNERLLVQLDEVGICAAAGSACSAANDEPSHVLRAINVSDQLARSSLRFSMGKSTTENELRKTISTLAALVA